MGGLSGIIANRSFGLLGSAHVRVRPYTDALSRRSETAEAGASQPPSAEVFRKVQRLREALEAIASQRAMYRIRNAAATAPQNAQVISSGALNLGTSTPAVVSSVEEVNTAPTSFSPFGPAWWASAAVAPWSGSGSTATATIGGVYDGSNGSGTLTFRVDVEGTHGQDDLKLKVYAPDDTEISQIDINKEDPLDTVYTLENGLSVTLGAGTVVKPEEFTVDTALLSTSYNPTQPAWTLSTAQATIGGTYDGSNGTGALTFRVDREGIHGINDLNLKVYAPDGSFIQDVNINGEDPITQVYSLNNGLTISLGNGLLIKDDEITVNLQTETSYSTTPHPGDSTADVTIGGVYDGAQGAGTLSFLVTSAGTHGVDDLALEVYAPDDSLIETISLLQTDPIDQVYQLSNGLTFELGSGVLSPNETFTVDVDHLVGSSVDPTRPFNGTRNANPNFDEGLGITEGSFDVNGVTISVSASDSLNSVLDRITQAGIDVSATFDAGSETVVLTRNTPGATKSIVLDNDSTGFLAATKLAGATVVPGDGDITTPLGDVASFAPISSGTIKVNDVPFAVDVDADSLQDIVGVIDASAADVSATIDTEAARVSIAARNPSASLVLDSQGTGFFSTLGINDGIHFPIPSRNSQRGYSQSVRRDLADAVSDVSSALNKLFEDPVSGVAADPFLGELRDQLRTAVLDSFDTDDLKVRTAFGIDLDFRPDSSDVFRFTAGSRNRLISQLSTASGAVELRELLFGENGGGDGLIEKLMSVVEAVEDDLRLQLATAGTIVDILA